MFGGLLMLVYASVIYDFLIFSSESNFIKPLIGLAVSLSMCFTLLKLSVTLKSFFTVDWAFYLSNRLNELFLNKLSAFASKL